VTEAELVACPMNMGQVRISRRSLSFLAPADRSKIPLSIFRTCSSEVVWNSSNQTGRSEYCWTIRAVPTALQDPRVTPAMHEPARQPSLSLAFLTVEPEAGEHPILPEDLRGGGVGEGQSEYHVGLTISHRPFDVGVEVFPDLGDLGAVEFLVWMPQGRAI
jgi:hypothetical protein